MGDFLRVLAAFEVEIEKRAAQIAQPGASPVKPGGDFVNAGPSMLSRLRWWAREMRAAAQWQPIETAPRDGGKRPILATTGHNVYIVWAVNGRNPCWTDGQRHFFDELTHWMPLPAGPEVDGG